ncbi:MAG: DUF1648 domain-containing protein [Salinivirgaceae bacterium]
MKKRPKIIIQLSTTDKLVEIRGLISIFAIWVLVILSYSKLPDSIPIHYSVDPQVENLGGKPRIFALPIVATLLFIGLTLLNK